MMLRCLQQCKAYLCVVASRRAHHWYQIKSMLPKLRLLVVVIVQLKFLLLYYSTPHIKPLSQSIQQLIRRKTKCRLFVHCFLLSLLRRALSMSSFMLSAFPNGSPLCVPMISTADDGSWCRASPRAVASARRCSSSSFSIAVATASRIWSEKDLCDFAVSTLPVRLSWVGVRSLSP